MPLDADSLTEDLSAELQVKLVEQAQGSLNKLAERARQEGRTMTETIVDPTQVEPMAKAIAAAVAKEVIKHFVANAVVKIQSLKVNNLDGTEIGSTVEGTGTVE